MNSKQLVISCMEGDLVERVPVLAPFSGHFACKMAGVKNIDCIRNPPLAARAHISNAEECGFDGMDAVFDFLSPAEACGSKIKMVDYGPIPVVEPILSDLKRFDDIGVPDPKDDYRFDASMKIARQIVEEKGDQYFMYPNFCGPFTLIGELRGLEKLFFDLMIEPSLVKSMMEFAVETIDRYIEDASELDVDAISFSDPTASGDFLQEEYFLNFVLPTISKCSKTVKKCDKKVMWHICGHSSPHLSALASTAVDIVSVDHVRVSKIADALHGKTILGNIRPEVELTNGSTMDVVKDSVDLINAMTGRKFILGAGCGLTLHCNIENLKMLRYSSEQMSKITR